jgi:hypothetical protein
MKTAITLVFVVMFNLATAQKLPSQANIFLRWNGEIEVTGPSLDREFSREDSSIAVADFIVSSRLRSVTIIRDKGWEGTDSRADIKRFEEVRELIRAKGLAFVVVSARSYPLPEDGAIKK